MQRAWIGMALALLAAGAGAKEAAVELASDTAQRVAPLNLAALNRTAQLAVTGTPGKTGFIPALDRVILTGYEAREKGPVELTLAFARPQKLQQVRLLFGEGEYTWSLVAADSAAALEPEAPGRRVLVSEQKAVSLGETWTDTRLDPKAPIQALRLTIVPADPARPVVLRELNLTGEQSLQSIELTAPKTGLRFNDHHPLTVLGYFSGGDVAPITSKALRWEIEPPAAARMSSHHRLWTRRPGPLTVRVRLGKFASTPLGLEVE